MSVGCDLFFFFFLVSPYQTIEISLCQLSGAPPHINYFLRRWFVALQPSHISFSSSCAGVAAAAGELAKDQRHQDAVEEAGVTLSHLL